MASATADFYRAPHTETHLLQITLKIACSDGAYEFELDPTPAPENKTAVETAALLKQKLETVGVTPEKLVAFTTDSGTYRADQPLPLSLCRDLLCIPASNMRALAGLVSSSLRLPCVCHAIVNATTFALSLAGPVWDYVLQELRVGVAHANRKVDIQEKIRNHPANTRRKKIKLLYMQRFTGYACFNLSRIAADLSVHPQTV